MLLDILLYRFLFHMAKFLIDSLRSQLRELPHVIRNTMSL